jgi:hypothetical protein
MRTRFLPLALSAAIMAAAPLPAFAGLSFNNLSATDFDNVVRELSANFAYSSVESASSLGGLGGFEFGVVGGTTTATNTYNLVKAASPSTNWKTWMPHAGILARLGLPYSFTAEAVIFPKVSISSVKFANYSGAVMWTPTELFFPDWPVTIATKFHYSVSSIDYSQTITDTTFNQTVTATPAFRDHMWGFQAILSKRFVVAEPFIGLGYIKAKGNFAINDPLGGTASLFAQSSGIVSSGSSNPSTTQFFAGLDLALGFFSLGGEFQSAFGTHSWDGRLSFRF